MSPQEWAARYLTAVREGSNTEATHIYEDAVYDLDTWGGKEFAKIVSAG
ncbi:hypothetical protein KIH74_22615 [Kineosporia sp. J2-2]|uniref:Uncharacterized protein n=1 Tax=Kineosporia corallincola TaxID=2835133 RepID=A0ABS5TKX7_9ACTN|nr:hypothetical protein [Kineosporia corallincola]MBT0771751.1 hypothetical protein [Kineosporia corallincola]